MKRWVCSAVLAAALLCGGAQAQTQLAFEDSGMVRYTGERYSVLSRGQANGLTFEQSGERYTVTETAIWQAEGIREEGLQEFALPRSLDEVRMMNRVMAQLNDEACFDRSVTADLARNETLPVYAAPSEEAYRGANGKAAVSLREPFTVLAEHRSSGWWLIEYAVSEEERRIGYIQRPEGAVTSEPAAGMWLIPLTLTVREDAALTDDPYGKCRELRRFAAGEEIVCLGYADALWAYVQTEIDGKEAWGFVPMRTLSVQEAQPDRAVMAQLAGTWVFAGGGELLGMGVIFHEDGTLTLCSTDDYSVFPPEKLIESGERYPYVVTAGPQGRYAEDARYVLELLRDDGIVERYGLAMTPAKGEEKESFGLYRGYGGGFYQRKAQ